MTPMPLDDTHTSRARLLAAGKSLFARMGYENVSTAAISRKAGTSESQLVRYFGGKAGLLQAIFNESWKPLNERLQRQVADAANAKEAVKAIFSTIISTFAQDSDLGFIFLFEGRRVRGNGTDVLLSEGFLEFMDLMKRLIRRGQRDGSFTSQFSEAAISAALVGTAEGMIRERILAQRCGTPSPFTEKEIRKIFAHFLDSLGVSQKKSAANSQRLTATSHR